MGTFSIWHWGVIAFIVIVYLGLAYLVARILGRLGFSRWWGLISLIPYLNIVGLCVLAYVKWPIERR